MDCKYISGPETSKLIKRSLKRSFPGVDFSVRYKSYAGGSSISVHWTDGPTTKRVESICNKFEGAGFDGMQDMKTYLEPCIFNGEAVRFGVDYVSASRRESFELLKEAAFRVAFGCDLPLLKIERSTSIYGTTHVEGGNYQVPYHFCPEDGDFAHDHHGGEWYEQLVYQVARSIDLGQEQKRVNLPERVCQELIDETVKRMVA